MPCSRNYDILAKTRSRMTTATTFSHQNDVGSRARALLSTRDLRRLKSEFVFFQSLSQLFQSTYFVKCRRTLLEFNSEGPYPSSEREIKFRRCLFMYSIKREIRHFHVVVVHKRQRNVQKGVMHVQSCCFGYETYCFLTFSSPSASLDLTVPTEKFLTRSSPRLGIWNSLSFNLKSLILLPGIMWTGP